MKHNNSFLKLFAFLITALFAVEAQAIPVSSDKVRGVALYSDDLTPVRGGTIEIVSTASSALGNVVLEKITINADGTFQIPGNYLNMTDDIKIMAYPNDIDGVASDFIQCEFKPSEVIVQTKEGVSVVIKVNRDPSHMIEKKSTDKD